MATNTVNLDALIPRDDFAAESSPSKGNRKDSISIQDLDNGFLGGMLRKPDFQRETTHWSPNKLAELVQAFVDADLIPAVILWQRGAEVFVIDGAHRLSALMSWVLDDYGDGLASLEYFGGAISDEQKAVAERARKEVKKLVGTYAEYKVAQKIRAACR